MKIWCLTLTIVYQQHNQFLISFCHRHSYDLLQVSSPNSPHIALCKLCSHFSVQSFYCTILLCLFMSLFCALCHHCAIDTSHFVAPSLCMFCHSSLHHSKVTLCLQFAINNLNNLSNGELQHNVRQNSMETTRGREEQVSHETIRQN